MAATLDARLRLNSTEFSGGLNRALRESNAAVGKMSAQFGTLRNVLGAGAVGGFGTAILGGLFESAIQMEKLEASMAATFGSQSVGAAQLRKVKDLAGEIGLGVREAAQAMIKFKSAGMSAAQSMSTIKAGYNAIIASGGGNEEFSRFSVAITQLKASPKVLQEELNQLRESLPTAAKLMKDAFGVTRSEDFQRLNISGSEFVSTLLQMMEKLPKVGDTMEKQVNRFKMQFEEFKAGTGDALRLPASLGMGLVTGTIQGLRSISDSAADLFATVILGDTTAMKRHELARDEELQANAERLESLAKIAEEREKAADQEIKDADAREKSRTNAEKMIGVIGKFNEILKKAAQSARDLHHALNMDNAEEAYNDQERKTGMQSGLADVVARTRDQLAAKFKGRDDAKADRFDALGMAEERTRADREEQWREKIERAGMTRSERKAERQSEKELRKNTEKAINREAREMLEKERADNRLRAFDNLKNNLGFMDEEGSKKRLKDQARKEQEDVGKKSIMTLGEIRDILKTLATA